MSAWTLVIHGNGPYNNWKFDDARNVIGAPKTDANIMAKDFVAKLKAAGHYIEDAQFTQGGRSVLDSK